MRIKFNSIRQEVKEIKIGEIKEVNGKIIKCIESDEKGTCNGCIFDKENNYNCLENSIKLGCCIDLKDNNKRTVIFVEISKEFQKS